MLFFFNDTATTEIYTLSLHDALPIFGRQRNLAERPDQSAGAVERDLELAGVLRVELLAQPGSDRLLDVRVDLDRKSTRLNSSHANISYAVFCLKKKKNNKIHKTAVHN